ncbi:MAG TPA: PhoU domain-containing protein [Acidimicrobiales bacterium]|nr:PhoU domain-containing protein [Acidimicrobiales bacterium]
MTLRAGFQGELDQLRLQVEVMAVRVAQNLERMEAALRTGDVAPADAALAADDDIDAMLVSLTERCYDLLAREAPVAGDLRFIVSVLRVLEELERIGDLALRVVKQSAEHALLAGRPHILERLVAMATLARDLHRTALDAWSAQDVHVAFGLLERSREMDDHYRLLVEDLLVLSGDSSARIAIVAVVMGRALGRIGDHTVIVGERLRYLLTGDPAYLASEVR